MGNKQNVPQVRFKGFTDAWEQRELKELASFAKGSGYSKTDITAQGTPLILYGRLYTKYETIINEVDTFTEPKKGSIYSKGNEVIVPASGETAEDIARASFVAKSGVLLGGDLNIIYPNDTLEPTFLALSISNGEQQKDLAKKAQGKSVVHLHNSDLETVKITYPKRAEQIQIGQYFSRLDHLITLNQCKLEYYKQAQKSIMQKLFSQEVRFKKKDGSNFADWDEKALSNVLTEYNEKCEKNGTYEHVSLTQEGVIPKTERYNRDFLVTHEDKQYRVTHLNDICYNPANLKFGVICRNKYGDGIFSPIYVTFKVNEDHDNCFIGYFVTNQDFINKALKYQQGTVYERMSVSPDDLLTMKVHIPTDKSEQTKIANFLSEFDALIKSVEVQLAAYKQLKKAMMQKMFV